MKASTGLPLMLLLYISHDQYTQPGGDSSLQVLDRPERAVEEDRLALL